MLGLVGIAHAAPSPGDAEGQRTAQPNADDAVARLSSWVMATGDHQGLPFIVIDKRASRVLVHDAEGRLRGTSPALVGSARGDDPIPGIGTRPISSIRPRERITPAGRFRAAMGQGPGGEEILWVDYEQALALHRVVNHVPAERRLQRLRSQDPAERRITYGCINVPVSFFDKVVLPLFSGSGGMVYILPEVDESIAYFSAVVGAPAPSVAEPHAPPGSRGARDGAALGRR